MGTNYYLYQKPDCKCCGRPFEPLHIGKNSGGWRFALHVMPEDGINTLDDWRVLWSAPGAFIRDEYGEKVSIADMERLITKREWRGGPVKHHDDQYCVGHGEGTWDYITGEFS
jgi:hypothetical protein